MLRGLVYFIYHHLAGVEFEVNNYLKRLITHAWIGLILVASALNISLHAQTVGGGTIEDPAIGPPPAYNYGSDTTGYVLIKNWDFGANGTISGNADLTTHFQFHDQFGLYANGGGYGSVIMAPDQASAIGSQPVEDPANPIREYLTDSMKTYLQPLNGAMIVDPNLRNTANGSFQAKWVLPNGGALLGKDMIWETRVRYVTPPYFWFAIWTSGNLWSSGAEMDLIESFGYDNGGGYTNYDGRYWHSSVVGGTQETNYHAHWGNAMASYGITNYDATQWHTWTWVYHADNTFTSYVDGIVVQRGSTYWTYGATETGQPINMSFIFDGAWGHQAVSSVNHTLAASELVGKYYEWDYSRVYLRDPATVQSLVGEDIGNVGIAGDDSYSDGTYTIDASGSDIWGNADSFRYMHQTMIGDGEISARVVSMTQSDWWVKTGLMMRESLNTNSRHAFILASLASKIRLQYRNATGGASGSMAASHGLPVWLKLARSGDVFTGYYSSDGVNWTAVGSQTISMPSTIHVGIAVTSHNNSALTTAVIDNVTLPLDNGLYIEAEDYENASGFSPLQVYSDASASAGAYVGIPNGSGTNLTPADTDDGYMDYTFELTAASDLTLWVLGDFLNEWDDSFHYKLDSGLWATANGLQNSGWTWMEIDTFLNVPVGQHTLRILRREDGINIDQFYLSPDGSLPQ